MAWMPFRMKTSEAQPKGQSSHVFPLISIHQRLDSPRDHCRNLNRQHLNSRFCQLIPQAGVDLLSSQCKVPSTYPWGNDRSSFTALGRDWKWIQQAWWLHRREEVSTHMDHNLMAILVFGIWFPEKNSLECQTGLQMECTQVISAIYLRLHVWKQEQDSFYSINQTHLYENGSFMLLKMK